MKKKKKNKHGQSLIGQRVSYGCHPFDRVGVVQSVLVSVHRFGELVDVVELSDVTILDPDVSLPKE